MRIFAAVRHSADPRFFYGALWAANFFPALRALGHEVVDSAVDLLPASRFMQVADGFTAEELRVRAAITSAIVEEVRRAHAKGGVDLFLSYFYNAHFDPSGFDEIHRLGIPSVNFYCNSIYQFDLVRSIAARAARSWHPEKDAAGLYRAVGARPVWVQMAADPEIYRPLPDRRRQSKACFVGQRYADRDRWLAHVVGAGIPLDIYGPGWNGANGTGGDREVTHLGRRQPVPGTAGSYAAAVQANIARDGILDGVIRTVCQARYRRETARLSGLFHGAARGPIPFERIASTFAEYDVVLNASNVWADGRAGSPLIPHVRLRDFEAPMCASCYLTGHTDEIGEFYDVGREIETYRTPEELVDKTRFLLSHPAEAARLREAGYRRARRDHTWQRRFEELFRKIALS